MQVKDLSSVNKNVYKDFDFNFGINPLTNDLATKTDINAINQSIRCLINTNFYERPFRPWIGSNIKRTLFEPADDISKQDVRDAVNETLNNYEKRIRVLQVLVVFQEELNSYSVQIEYEIKETGTTASYRVILKRLR